MRNSHKSGMIRRVKILRLMHGTPHWTQTTVAETQCSRSAQKRGLGESGCTHLTLALKT
jgi:hypothetical protein